MLKPTSEQKTQLAALQKEVDAGLDKVLTDDQKKQLKQMRADFLRGGPPGGPGGGGPPGGPGGPGGGPPAFLFAGPPGGSAVFRAYRYGPDYPGLAGKDLKPGKTVEELQPEGAGEDEGFRRSQGIRQEMRSPRSSRTLSEFMKESRLLAEHHRPRRCPGGTIERDPDGFPAPPGGPPTTDPPDPLAWHLLLDPSGSLPTGPSLRRSGRAEGMHRGGRGFEGDHSPSKMLTPTG